MILIIVGVAAAVPLNPNQANVLMTALATIGGGTAFVEFAKAWGNRGGSNSRSSVGILQSQKQANEH